MKRAGSSIRSAIRSFALIAGLFSAGAGISQPIYGPDWEATYSATQNQINPVLAEGDPTFAYERQFTGNFKSSIILTKHFPSGSLSFSLNLNGSNPTARFYPKEVHVDIDGAIYVVGVKQTAIFTNYPYVAKVSSSGTFLWSWTSADVGTPQAFAMGASPLLVKYHNGSARYIRLNGSTGQQNQNSSLGAGSFVAGAKLIRINQVDTYHIYGQSGLLGAFWRITETGNASATFNWHGIESTYWQKMSADGKHLYGVLSDGSGYRAVKATRTDVDSSIWASVPLNLPITSKGAAFAFSEPSMLYQVAPAETVVYPGGDGNIVNRVQVDSEGFMWRLPSLDLGVIPSSLFFSRSGRSLHAYANVSGSSSRVIGIHPNLPSLHFLRQDEVVNDSTERCSVGSFVSNGIRKTFIRSLLSPYLPDNISVYDIPARRTGSYSALNYNVNLVKAFGGGTLTTTSPFTHGVTSLSVSPYYEPDLNFVGTDVATYAAGNPPISTQVHINVGMPIRVLDVRFKNLGEVIGGRTLEAKLVISRPAPAGGISIPLSTNSSLISVPSSVAVLGGQKEAKFLVSSQKVYAVALRNVKFGPGPNDVAEVRLIPGGLNTFNIGPKTVKGGTSATGSVSLTGPLPNYLNGATIAITANGGSVTFPASVNLAPGTINKQFTIETQPVAQTVVRTFTITQGVTQMTSTLTITP